jgi:hypothetical protein
MCTSCSPLIPPLTTLPPTNNNHPTDIITIQRVYSQLFGKDKYGASLSAVATVQQLVQTVAPAAFQAMYKVLEAEKWGFIRYGDIIYY